MAAQWLALSPHSNKLLDLVHQSVQMWNLCIYKFACSLCVCVGVVCVLQFPPSDWRQAGLANWKLWIDCVKCECVVTLWLTGLLHITPNACCDVGDSPLQCRAGARIEHGGIFIRWWNAGGAALSSYSEITFITGRLQWYKTRPGALATVTLCSAWKCN